MKTKTIFFSVFLFVVYAQLMGVALGSSQKIVIGPRRVGFFSNFFGCLNMLAWCERNNRIPVMYWDERCCYWQKDGYNNATNAWEYYFEPVSHLNYEVGDLIYRAYFAPDGTGVKFMARTCSDTLSYKLWGNRLINKYVKIKPQVQQKIDAFVEENFKDNKVIGIHLRGTDKKYEVKAVSPDDIFREANKYEGYYYFVATDERRLLDLAIEKLNGPVIYYDADRSSNSTQALHIVNGSGKRGEDVLIEVVLLSQCERLIHTCSNVSSAVLFFNPTMKNTLLLANKNRSVGGVLKDCGVCKNYTKG